MAKFSSKRVTKMDQYLNHVEKLHGPAPENIFKAARLKCGMTLVEVASAANCSKLALIRLEQGIPASPIDNVVLYFIDRGFGYTELLNGYEEYQKIMRYRHARLFGDIPPVGWFAETSNISQHPFTLLLSRWCLPDGTGLHHVLNPTEFSKLLCFPQSVADHFLNKIARQQSVPRNLKDVLNDAGYSRRELEVLDCAYENYRAFTLHGREPVVGNVVPPIKARKTRGSNPIKVHTDSSVSSTNSVELIKAEALEAIKAELT